MVSTASPFFGLDGDAGLAVLIILNQETYLQMSEGQRVALIDHELSHCQTVYDGDGEPKLDEQDRIVYRIRKHDFQEFAAIVRRHGENTPGLSSFAKSAQLELFKGKESAE